MADFNSVLSKHLSTTFSALQSRYSSTPAPVPLPFKQSPMFTDFYKFNSETLEWSPFRRGFKDGEQTTPIEKILVFSWNINRLVGSPKPNILDDAVQQLIALLPKTSPPAVLLLQNVPAMALPAILWRPFLRRRFLISNINELSWPTQRPNVPWLANEGNVILLDCALAKNLDSLFRVRLPAEVGGDVGFVDLNFGKGVVRVGSMWVEGGGNQDSSREAVDGAVEWVRASGIQIGILGGGRDGSEEREDVITKSAFLWTGKEGEGLRIEEDVRLREEYGLFRAELKLTA